MILHKSLQPRAQTSDVLSRFISAFSRPATDNTKTRNRYTCRACYVQRLHARRPLSTASQYRPHTFDPSPPPPRNSNVPNTSIAGSSLEVENTLSPSATQLVSQKPKQISPSSSDNLVTVDNDDLALSLPESEAQNTSPVSTTLTPPSSPLSASPSPRKSRLRSRKAAMTLTPSATDQLRRLLAQPEPKLIRVGVKNRGCSGLAYHLEYVDKPGAFDETVEQDGVKVLIDSKALFSIIGSEMDWVKDKLNERFVFRNPNISKSTLSSFDLNF